MNEKEIKAVNTEKTSVDKSAETYKLPAKQLRRYINLVNNKKLKAELEPIIAVLVSELGPKSYRDMALVLRIAKLQHQINQSINVEVTKKTMARYIRRVIA
jgi:hypothetical protein